MIPASDNFEASRADRRKFLLGLLFCSAAGVAAWRQPWKKIDYLGRHKLDSVVPKTIGRWNFETTSGLVLPPDDPYLKSIYTNLLTRTYSDASGSRIMLLLAQSASQTGFLQIHRPETCYTAGGFQISPLAPHPIRLGDKVVHANAMEAIGNGAPEHIVYWTRIGNLMPLSWRDQKIAVAKQNLEGLIPDAILVRISMVSPDIEVARSAIDDFVRTMIASIQPGLRSVLVV
jgi:EpsI family protein